MSAQPTSTLATIWPWRVQRYSKLPGVSKVWAAIPFFREQGHGVPVNVSSVLGKVPSPLQSPYIASKFGINGLSDALRQELRDAPGVEVTTGRRAERQHVRQRHGTRRRGRRGQRWLEARPGRQARSHPRHPRGRRRGGRDGVGEVTTSDLRPDLTPD